MTEIAAQKESTGILYEPYVNEWKNCIFEDGDVKGTNERYEFRCDAALECCGRICCTPEETGIPWWLKFLLAALLLLLCCLLPLLLYLCCRKMKKKNQTETKKVPVYRPDLYHGSTGGYRSIKHADDLDGTGNGDNFNYKRRRDSYDEMPNVVGHGYPNKGYDERWTSTDGNNVNGGPQHHQITQTAMHHGPPSFQRPSSFHEEETFEESFKEEIEVERTRRPNSISSQESILINEHFKPLIKTPGKQITEQLLEKPKPLLITKGEFHGSQVSLENNVKLSELMPQRAEHAFHRKFEPDPMKIEQIPAPKNLLLNIRNADELMGSEQKPVLSHVELSQPKSVQHMFLRPGFDNVPSY